MIRTDVGEAHRLSLSARVLSAWGNQVKAKTAAAEALLTPGEMAQKPFAEHRKAAALLRLKQANPALKIFGISHPCVMR